MKIVTTGTLTKDFFLRGKSKVRAHQSFKWSLLSVRKPLTAWLWDKSYLTAVQKKASDKYLCFCTLTKIHLQKEHWKKDNHVWGIWTYQEKTNLETEGNRSITVTYKNKWKTLTWKPTKNCVSPNNLRTTQIYQYTYKKNDKPREVEEIKEHQVLFCPFIKRQIRYKYKQADADLSKCWFQCLKRRST